MGWFGRLFQRLRTDEAVHRFASIREWCEVQPGVKLVKDAEPRTVVRVAGAVEALRVRPRQGVPQIEAQISDGTGAVTAVWLGRRSIPGLALGVRLILEGRLAIRDERAEIINPIFEFGQRPGER
ncbi:MAG: OB-fold nucleic acid binding domain-containing protein [Actinomycetota bacterium]